MESHPFKAYWATALEGLSSGDVYHTASFVGRVLAILFLSNYLYTLLNYHRVHKLEGNTKGRLPPRYPSFIPHLGPFFQLWWDHGGFVERVSSYAGKLTSNRVSIMGYTYYSFQDRETIERLFKQSTLSSSITMYGFVNSHLLGAPRKAMSIYRADDSGPFPQPHPRSKVQPHNRIDYITHHSVFRGLTGPGLHPATLRYAADVARRLRELGLAHDRWTEMPDLAQFFRDVVGASTLQSVLGPSMLRLNPTFVRDMFAFDGMFPTFAPGLPRWMMPKAHKFRDDLVGQFKSWYIYARAHFDKSHIAEDGDGDPYWGSAMIRHRQNVLLKIDQHDDEAVARVDLGLAWATIGNVVLSSMFSAFHVFKDEELLSRVRREIEEYVGDGTFADIDPQHFGKEAPLLASVYAETLRLYIKVYSVYSSPHEDVDLGRWKLPKGALAVLNSEPSHMDETFWNTKGGKHPVRSFWADRFLVDPADPESGPINAASRKAAPRGEKNSNGKPYFSTEGCEGAWIPYGGGYSMCPGRFLAKNVIIFTSALLASEYDIEIHSDKPEFTKKRFGMGVEDLKSPLPFRIKKRAPKSA